MFEDLSYGLVVVVDHALHVELGLQILFNRQVEDRVDRVFAPPLGPLRHRAALEPLVLFQIHFIAVGFIPAEHRNLAGLTGAAALFNVGAWSQPSAVHIRPQRGTAGRVRELGLALFERTHGGLIPGRKGVEQADALEGELEFYWYADTDRQDHGFLERLLRPIEFLSPVVRTAW